MRVLHITFFILIFLTGLASAEPGSHLKPGDTLVNIEEPDQSGEQRRFKDLLGPNGGVLVVYRSADW